MTMLATLVTKAAATAGIMQYAGVGGKAKNRA
jgi:hypothetical protein